MTRLTFVGFPRKTGTALATIPTLEDAPRNVGVATAEILAPVGFPRGGGTTPALTLTPVGFPTNVGTAAAEILTPVGSVRNVELTIVMETAVEVVKLPEVSRAVAVRLCTPSANKVELKSKA